MGMPISRLSYADAASWIMHRGQERAGGYVCFANVHMMMTAQDHKLLRMAMHEADLVCADGKPLCIALSLLGEGKQERVAGMDMMPSILAEAEQKQVPVYFLGGTPTVLKAVKERAIHEHPALLVAGAESPPFRPLQPDEERDLVNRINASGAGILFVALGCPKQEIWMMRLSPHLKPVCLGVGGAFPVYAGVEKRAPVWAQKLSLEWLWRLVQDPKRLWKRYLATNSLFMMRLLLEFFPALKSNGKR